MGSLQRWMEWLLPTQGVAAREGAWQLVRAMMVDFTVQLCGLARQLERSTGAASGRQYLSRWLSRSRWEPQEWYGRLPEFWPQERRRAREAPLLVDCTVLGERWNVLQGSAPWRGRALPVYRVVVPYRQPEAGQTELLLQALRWLGEHLPGRRARYVWVRDRGFPSHALIRTLQESGWRSVLRSGSNWVLATSEAEWPSTVALYRQRMQIEAEFRDVQGPLGLDQREHWEDRDRAARMLAWVAVYEWRLALLYLPHPLQEWGEKEWPIGGALSWITITRTWIKQSWRAALGKQTLVREAP